MKVWKSLVIELVVTVLILVLALLIPGTIRHALMTLTGVMFGYFVVILILWIKDSKEFNDYDW